jgi:FecR protein
MRILAVAAAVVLSIPNLISETEAASSQIGLAVTVKNDVSKIEPSFSKVLSGDDIYRDEVVRTMNESAAKFVLRDSTNLIVGPNSTLKLDRAVFSDEKNVGDIALKLTAGSFRFITGSSRKESYSITTPIATMGVRGTTLDMLIEQFKNTVVLKDGQSRVCAAGKCIELMKVGDTAVITLIAGKTNIALESVSTWSFDGSCSGMCSAISFAEAENNLTTGSIGTGGGTSEGGGPTSVGSAGNVIQTNSPSNPNTVRSLLQGAGTSSSAISAEVSPH